MSPPLHDSSREDRRVPGYARDCGTRVVEGRGREGYINGRGWMSVSPTVALESVVHRAAEHALSSFVSAALELGEVATSLSL